MEFSVTQQRAISLIASGINFRQCAKMLGIQRTTLWQWRKIPAFQDAIKNEKQRFVADYRTELDKLKLKAISQLNQYLDDPDITMERKISICFDSLNMTKTIQVNYIGLE